MRLPHSRGPLSDAVRRYLSERQPDAEALQDAVDTWLSHAPDDVVALCADGDLQLALAMLYELHFTGFEDVDDDREWDLGALGAVQRLEPVLLEVLFRAAADDISGLASAQRTPGSPNGVAARLAAVVAADDGPSPAQSLMGAGNREWVVDYVRQRSVYQLREADPHTLAIPRLRGRSKSALVEIQRDEYGEGAPGALHADLYATMMRELGLDDAYGAYWNAAVPEMFAVLNLMSALALSRRWRGALMGHLAAYEMTSSLPSRKLSTALRKVGAGDNARRYYDEHVEADAVHEQIAAHDLCGSLAEEGDEMADQIVLGAAACLVVERCFGQALLQRWQHAQAA